MQYVTITTTRSRHHAIYIPMKGTYIYLYIETIYIISCTHSRPMTMQTRCCKNKSAEDTLVPPLWEKRGTCSKKYICIYIYIFVDAAARGGTWTFEIVNEMIRTPRVTIDRRSRHRIDARSTRFVSGKASECRWRPWRYQEDPWSRGGEVAHGVLRWCS